MELEDLKEAANVDLPQVEQAFAINTRLSPHPSVSSPPPELQQYSMANEHCTSCRQLRHRFERMEERVSDWVSICHQCMNDFGRFIDASMNQIDLMRAETKILINSVKLISGSLGLLEDIIKEGQKNPRNNKIVRQGVS
ncbi:unnamed protein product [Linum trigynum]|uniref:Uncharacterized protein n=1 Tax=Linum trigynum TaxID=586398 RepID=A0AAV2EWV4_9ROSI